MIWDYPGTVEELLADWKKGHAPTLRPIITSMPPKWDFEAGRQMRGVLHEDVEDNDPRIRREAIWIYSESGVLKLADGTIVPCPMTPPTAEQVAAGDIPPLARICVKTDELRTMLDMGTAPITWHWLMVHFTICEACADQFRQILPGVPIRVPEPYWY